MSVLMKGAIMPIDCDHCQFSDINDCDLWMLTDVGNRHPECPLAGLPEKHGDLIDKDALKKDYRMGNDCNHCETGWKSCEYDRFYSKMDFCGWIDDAPVVIEAEGEG